MTHTHNVLRLKTAKAIINRCYEADNSGTIGADGLYMFGNCIDATAIKVVNGWDVVITSTVLEVVALKSLVDDVYNTIAASKSTNS